MEQAINFKYSFYNQAHLILKLLIVIFVFDIGSGCKKFVDVQTPVTSVNSNNVYNDDATATAVLTGLYSQMSSRRFTSIPVSIPSISLFAGLSADELNLWSGAVTSGDLVNTTEFYYYTNSLYANTAVSYGGEFFSSLYNTVYICNSAIEGLNISTSLTPAVKQQLLGEALFMRAFCYFYLTNLYGNVPLVIGTDYKINALVARSPKEQVYQQIIMDLRDAQNLLSPTYLNATLLRTTGERTRPTKWAATALLARAYLYTNKYDSAEIQASAVINYKSLYDTVPLNSVFLKNSKEAIWQLQPVNSGWNTEDARLFIFPNSNGPTSSNPVYLSNSLINSFEIGDNRASAWINSITVGNSKFYYPYKYKIGTLNAPVTEYTMVFRLGEQYLIRAEARVQQGNIGGSQSDLNVIRGRAGLGAINASDQSSLLAAILHERQTELFTELGHRWLDLKRTGNIDNVMPTVTPIKANGAAWQSYQQLYPMSFTDLERNPNLIQSPGYN